MKKNFKGFGLNELGSIALMFVIIAIVLAMGGRILGGVQTELEETASVGVTNEGPATFPNATANFTYELNTTYYPVVSGSVRIFNGSDILGEDLNYTVLSYALGQFNITNWNNTIDGTETVEINYTFTRPEYTMAYNATGKGLEGIGTFADWMPLLAIIIISVIIISMLIGGFGGSIRMGGKA